jgi:hypothetical protein
VVKLSAMAVMTADSCCFCIDYDNQVCSAAQGLSTLTNMHHWGTKAMATQPAHAYQHVAYRRATAHISSKVPRQEKHFVLLSR